MSPFFKRSTNSGMPSKAAEEQRAVAMAGLDGAHRPETRLIGLDEHGLHVRVGGQHVLRELERLVSRVGLHLLQAGLLGEPRRLHGVTKTSGARLSVFARLRDRDETNRAVGPTLVLERSGQRLADALRALMIVGDDERDILAAVGADVCDDDWNLRARGERENAWRGRAVGGRDGDAGNAARDRVLRILELGLGAVVQSRAP